MTYFFVMIPKTHPITPCIVVRKGLGEGNLGKWRYRPRVAASKNPTKQIEPLPTSKNEAVKKKECKRGVFRCGRGSILLAHFTCSVGSEQEPGCSVMASSCGPLYLRTFNMEDKFAIYANKLFPIVK